MMVQKMKKKNVGGFTLIELIVVIAILGILAAIIIPRFSGFQDKARSTAALVEAKQIATAIDSLQAESPTGDFPTDEDTILNLAFGAAANAEGDWPTNFATDYNNANGGFSWEVNGFTAGRTSATDPVELD